MRPEDICRTYTLSIILRRWGATWLDLFLFGITLLGLLALLGERYVGVAFGVWSLLLLVYYPLLEGLTGKTFGKWLCGLKVVDANGASPGLAKAILRTLLRLVEINPLLAGGIPAAIAVWQSAARQRLGDMAAKTYVLKVEDLARLTSMSLPVAPFSDSFMAIPSIPAPGISPLHAPTGASASASPSLKPAFYARRTGNWALPGACLLSVSVIGLIWGGTEFIRRAEAGEPPITMTCEKFLQSPPKEGWYHLTDCEMNMGYALSMTYKSQTGVTENDSLEPKSDFISEIYVPVFTEQDEEQKESRLVLATDDEKARNLLSTMRSLGDPDEKTLKKWIEDNRSQFFVHRDITGMVHTELGLAETTREKIGSVKDSHIAAGFVFIKEGEKPIHGEGVAAIVAGVLISVGAITFWILFAVGGPPLTYRSWNV